MKGLLIKDLYSVWENCKVTLAMVLFFFLAYFEGETAYYFLLYPCLCVSFIPDTLYGIDEKNKWERYALSLPIAKTQLVSCKYLIGLILNLSTISLMSLNYFKNNMFLDTFKFSNYLGLFSFIFAISFFSVALKLPFVFKYGAERGHQWSLVTTIVVVMMSSMLLLDVKQYIVSDVIYSPVLLVIISLAVYFLSWICSIKVYKKRDF